MKRFFLGLALSIFAPLASFAESINFSALTQAGSSANCVGPSYSTGGFTFTDATDSAGVCVWQTGSGFYTGETMLFENTPNGNLVMTPNDGVPFSVESIDLATAYNDGGPSPVDFIGHLHGGGTVTADLTLTATGISTFTFPSTFTDLDSLSWVQTLGFNQFTNVVVNASQVPEPNSVPLLGLGLLSLGFAARRLRIVNSR